MIKGLEHAYLKIINKIPDVSLATPKLNKRQIKEIMREHSFDEDYIESISDDFCQGFGVAKNIILKELRKELDKIEYMTIANDATYENNMDREEY